MDALGAKWQGIVDRITKILREREWSQAELARRAGVPRSYITRVMQVLNALVQIVDVADHLIG